MAVAATQSAALPIAELASEFVLSEKTVETHVSSILMKRSLRNRVQAVILAYEAGIVVPGRE